MTVKNPLNDTPQLQNLGIDHDMITRHAGDMNLEFNRMYNEHVMNGGPSIQNDIMPQAPAARPVQQAPAPTPSVAPVSQPAAAQGSDLNIIQAAIQHTLTSSVQAQNNTLERFMKHMVDEQKKMVAHIQELQAKLDSVRQAAGNQPAATQQVETKPVEQQAPQQQEQQAPVQQQSSGSQQITASHNESDETAKLREQVSIENMFNFSGVGRGNAKRA